MNRKPDPHPRTGRKPVCTQKDCICHDWRCENCCAKYRHISDCKGAEPERDGGCRT